MFDNKSNVDCFQYSIDLSKPISFFFDLIDSIRGNIFEDESIETLFKKDFLDEVSFNGVYDDTLHALKYLVANYFEKSIFDKIDFSKTKVLFYYKAKNLIFYYQTNNEENSAITNLITNLIKKYNIFNTIVESIENEKLKFIFDTITPYNFNELFGSTVSIKGKKDILSPFIYYEFLKTEFVELDILDEADIWVNKKELIQLFKISLPDENVVNLVQLNEGGDSINFGIKVDTLVFPIINFDLQNMIKDEFKLDYYWILFKDVYKHSHNRNKSVFTNSLLEKFKKDMFSSELNLLLSNLENNHCIPKEKLPNNKLKDYFEEVSRINNLKNIDNFDFFVSNLKGATALGIYARKKIGENYNLLHWIINDTEKHHHFNGIDAPKIKNQDKIFALKPEIAFYFVSNYFEDLLENAIRSIGKEHLKNFELYVNNISIGEFDFLIKSNSKLCFIEAKTKLTNEYIDNYITKCNNIIKNIQLINEEIKVDFYLIAAYSDSSCENKKFFFDNRYKKYNHSRVGSKTKPYFFKIPIPQHKGYYLTCIAEPEFKKLKSLINKI